MAVDSLGELLWIKMIELSVCWSKEWNAEKTSSLFPQIAAGADGRVTEEQRPKISIFSHELHLWSNLIGRLQRAPPELSLFGARSWHCNEPGCADKGWVVSCFFATLFSFSLKATVTSIIQRLDRLTEFQPNRKTNSSKNDSKDTVRPTSLLPPFLFWCVHALAPWIQQQIRWEIRKQE